MAVLWFKPWMGEFKLSDWHYLWHCSVMPSGQMAGSGRGTYAWNVNFHYPLMQRKTWERWIFIIELLKSKGYHTFQGQLSVCNALWKKSAPCVWKVPKEKHEKTLHGDCSFMLVPAPPWLPGLEYVGLQEPIISQNSLKWNGIWTLMPLNVYEDFRPDRWMGNCFALFCHSCQTSSTSHSSGRPTQATGRVF